MSNRTVVLGIAAVLLCSVAALPQDSAWTTRLLPAEEDWTYSHAQKINEEGLIVGRYGGVTYQDTHAVVWTGGGYIELEDRCGIPPGYVHCEAWDINESGLIGGEVKVRDGSLPIRAVLWDYYARTVEIIHPAGTGHDDVSRANRVYDDGSALLTMYDSFPGGFTARGYLRGPSGVGNRLYEPPGDWESANVLDARSDRTGVGFTFNLDPVYHGHAMVWYPDGSTLDLHPEIVAQLPPAEGAVLQLSIAYNIGPDGTITGFARDDGITRSYAWVRDPQGGYTFLTGGSYGDPAVGPGPVGRIVGGSVGSFMGADARYAAVWIDGVLGVLPRPAGFGNMRVLGMDAKARIVGSANFEGIDHPFKGSRAYIAEPTEGGDFDGDALEDQWELQGYTHDNGNHVDLFSMGANPLRRDVFVEVDSMAGHRPDPETLQPVIDAFKAHDIALHVHIDEDLPFDAELGWLDALERYVWEEFDAIKTAHFDEELESAVRYCVFGHRLATLTDSGLARGEPSSDFIVSLGAFVEESGSTDPWMQAGTFMHELGHTLGLRHGGADVTNRKPNYLSVMNYDFQKQGLRVGGQDGHFDYSQVKLADLDEGALNETAGLGIEPLVAGYQTLYRVVTLDPITFETTVVAVWSGEVQGSIDWNGSGSIDGAAVSADINGNGSTEMLTGHHDWAALDFNGGTVGFGVGLPPPPPPPETEVVEELTVEEAKLIPPPPVEGMAGRAGRRSVRISWTPVGPYGQGSYKVYRWSDTQDRELVAETQASLISDRPGRGTWHYVVTVTDSLGAESLDSELLTLRVR